MIPLGVYLYFYLSSEVMVTHLFRLGNSRTQQQHQQQNVLYAK